MGLLCLCRRCTDYRWGVREQGLKEEKLADLEEVHEKQCIAWIKVNHNRPMSTIVFLRDGISESAFEHMGRQEIEMIRRAHAKLGIWPALLFIVVQKRNHTRAFLKSSMPGSPGEHFDSVPPGTIFRVSEKNFWLVPHYALKGTACVPSYHVLENSPGRDATPQLTQDQYEQLVYDLCHLYYKCSRSVSVPAPVYYADKAAERATALYRTDGSFYGDKLSDAQCAKLFF